MEDETVLILLLFIKKPETGLNGQTYQKSWMAMDCFFLIKEMQISYGILETIL